MSEPLIGIIGIIILLFLILVSIHISYALIVVGFIGVALITGLGPASSSLSSIPFNISNDYNFAVVPLFILMSAFVSRSGIAREAYDMARAWIGHIKGGLAMATVGACGIFAATTGSSMACAVAMGKVAYPEMQKNNYSSGLAAGCIAAGGTLGILIPPSISFVVIGILTEVSIGRLFMAGIIPGILEVIFYWVTIYIMCTIRPAMGPAAAPTSFKTKVNTLKYTWPVIALFALVIGGIYLGVFTPSEAGGVGAFGALVIGLSRRTLSWSGFTDSLKETVRMAGMLMILLIGAFILMRFIAVSRISFVAAEFIAGLTINRYIILVIIMFVYIILGMFFDVMAIIILTVPIIFPTIVALNFNLVWFGVILVRVAEVGFITPPFGLNLFGLMGATNIPASSLYRGVFPFVMADFCHIALLVAVPSLSLFLPNLMM